MGWADNSHGSRKLYEQKPSSLSFSLPGKVLQNYFRRTCTANTPKYLCHEVIHFISIILNPTTPVSPPQSVCYLDTMD